VRRGHALAVLAASLATALASAAAPDEDFNAVLQLLAQRRHGHVSFTEVHRIALLKQPLHASGELFYDAPDHLEKRTLEPRAESLVLDHGMLTVRRGQRTRVLELASYPEVAPFVESIRATLAGDRAGLERYFTVDFSGGLAHWSLELTPKDPAVARSIERITISGAQATIATVAVRQRDGDSSLVTIGPEITP